jgi:uncharacterized RDD family membrane protein YckC
MNPYPRPEDMMPNALMQDEILTSGVLMRRVAAWWVDAVLIAMLVAAAWSMGVVFGVLTLGLALPLLGGLPALPILYTWLWVASPLSATPGQALFGLSVRRDADLGRPSLTHALVYALGYYVTLCLGAIWLGIALLTVRRRALHDIIGGIVVVRSRALTPPAGSWNMGANRGGGAWTPR